MITKDILEKKGLTPDKLKALFVVGKESEKIKELLNITRARIKDGMMDNLRDFRHWWAMDVAYDVPFDQTTYTMVRSFAEKAMRNDMSSAQVLQAAQDWGVAGFLRDGVDAKGKPCKQVDLPVFFKIHLPLVRAYENIRWAKLFNDRNTFPLLKYEPLKSTAKNRLKCEIITDVVDAMSEQMGYRGTLRQWIFNGLHYGISLMFPVEDWYVEQEPAFDEEKSEVVLRIKKQGLRYNLPHPSRVFYDKMYRIGTINSDSGCKYAGYWRLVRFNEINDSDAYWNKDKVSIGHNELLRQNAVFFSTVYPCQMEFPATNTSSGAGRHDRESRAAYYTSEHGEKGVVLTEIYQKLVPKRYGLGDLDCAIWFRFLMANDVTPVYVAPICYTPPLYLGYDAHEERSRNVSLSMEILPFQDHMSNLISQQILTAKQNLLRVVFADKDIVQEQYLRQIQNRGEDLYRELAVIPYSSRKSAMSQSDVRQAFHSIQFPMASTVELMSTFRLLLDTLERVLVFSAQEVGAVASHEQTAEETRIIAGSVNNRLALTDSFLEDAINAWKRQLYASLMAYGNQDVYAQVSSADPVTVDTLKELNFTIDEPGVPGHSNLMVRGAVNSLKLEGFVSGREGENRINNPEIAAAMSQFMQIMMGNQLTALAIGPQQAIEVFNVIARIAGLPRDFKLRVDNRELVQKMMSGQQQDPQEMQQIFQKLTEDILNRAGEQSAKITQSSVEPLAKAINDVAQATKQNSDDVGGLKQAIDQLLSRLQMAASAASRGAPQ